jgi:hypothetical protein
MAKKLNYSDPFIWRVGQGGFELESHGLMLLSRVQTLTRLNLHRA